MSKHVRKIKYDLSAYLSPLTFSTFYRFCADNEIRAKIQTLDPDPPEQANPMDRSYPCLCSLFCKSKQNCWNRSGNIASFGLRYWPQGDGGLKLPYPLGVLGSCSQILVKISWKNSQLIKHRRICSRRIMGLLTSFIDTNSWFPIVRSWKLYIHMQYPFWIISYTMQLGYISQCLSVDHLCSELEIIIKVTNEELLILILIYCRFSSSFRHFRTTHFP